MNKLCNCSSGENLSKAVGCLFHVFMVLIQAKTLKEAKQSTSSSGRTTPQPVSERSFMIFVEKNISECSERRFILLLLFFL